MNCCGIHGQWLLTEPARVLEIANQRRTRSKLSFNLQLAAWAKLCRQSPVPSEAGGMRELCNASVLQLQCDAFDLVASQASNGST